MEKRNKWLSLVLCMAMVLTSLTGCGSQTKENSSEGSSNNNNSVVESSQDVAGGIEEDLPEIIARAKADTNFNEEGYPIVKETVKKTIMVRKTSNIGEPAEMETLNYIAEKMNIELEWIVVGSDGWSERVSLMMATDDLPDIIIKGSIPTLSDAIEDGQLVAIDDLLEYYSTGLKPLLEQYPGVNVSARASDGKMYCLPGIKTSEALLTGHRNLWINQKWLDNLGLDTPTTTDELLDVLRAFRDEDADGDGDPTNEIPYGVEDAGAKHTASPQVIAGLFGLYSNLGTSDIQVDGDRASYLKNTDDWKEVLQYMNTMYTEGLLDNEVYTQTGDTAIAKMANANLGVFGESYDDLFSTVADQYVPLAPVQSPNGKQPVIALSSNHAGSTTFITSADESPWVSFRLLDYFYTYEGSMTLGCFNEDLIGITCQQYEDGSWDYTDEMLNDERGVAVAVGEACPLPGGSWGCWLHDENVNYALSQNVRDSISVWKPYYQTDTVYSSPLFDSETKSKVAEIRTDLDVYVAECQAKFITGEMSFDEWDNYCNTLKSLRVDELVSYYQAYLDSIQ